MTKRNLGLFFLMVVLALAEPAAAQATDPVRAEAADRFDRALRLVNVGDLSGGLAEFQRAYSLVPSPIVLYNQGLVFAALRRPVEASRALSKALTQAELLTTENAERARRVLREQNELIGGIVLDVEVQQGSVEVDGVEVARLPLTKPLEVSIGARVIGVVTPGYAPARQEVMLAGNETKKVRLDLVPIEGVLAHIKVTSSVPGADVLLDGQRVARTPLEASLAVAPGTHHVEVRRPGYVTQGRSITLQSGSRADLSLSPVVDEASLQAHGGYLDIRTNESQAVVSVDSRRVGVVAGPLRLPEGPHRLRLERGGFLPSERDVEVPLGSTAKLSVVFEPTPETRARYVAAAETHRTWSLVTLGTGLVVASGGITLALVEQNELNDAQASLDRAKADAAAGSERRCDTQSLDLTEPERQACLNRLEEATDHVNSVKTLRTVGWVAAGLGGAAAATGLILWLTGDDPHRYDRKEGGGKLLGSVALTPILAPGWFAIAGKGTF